MYKRQAAFAASPAGQRERFTAYPATWFGQDRFDDNPAEWARKDAPALGAPAITVPLSTLAGPIDRRTMLAACSQHGLAEGDFAGKGLDWRGEPLYLLFREKREALGIVTPSRVIS